MSSLFDLPNATTNYRNADSHASIKNIKENIKNKNE